MLMFGDPAQRQACKQAREPPETDIVHTMFGVNQFCNDPTAGSPTVTLLRLLLPLNDQV